MISVCSAGFYRRDRWEAPLADALMLLRECRQHGHDVQVRGGGYAFWYCCNLAVGCMHALSANSVA